MVIVNRFVNSTRQAHRSLPTYKTKQTSFLPVFATFVWGPLLLYTCTLYTSFWLGIALRFECVMDMNMHMYVYKYGDFPQVLYLCLSPSNAQTQLESH